MSKRVIVIGASGAAGSAVAAALGERHQVLSASRSGQYRVDVTDPVSITDLYRRATAEGPVHAVAFVAGVTPFKALGELALDDFRAGLDDKLLGQVELVRQGIHHLADGGSFTLMAGVLADDPILTGAVASTVNGALESFVKAAAIELPRGLRINAVSPEVLVESWDDYGPFFPGHVPVPAAEVGRAYVRSVDGAQTGQVYKVGF
ncbi:NAD(P)-dependent dehydrogenase, short-chain alcohol dehydrogenase family [Quadrisphaera granulorum]|uniref:NAD(P)-dependent dehydrogenase (Short-subunit alcohol dehydrogenase family) n=1 Tax=Quadrisphaera granulorum TaxID=317664 RepID=A0A316AA08_9ACTN|nr:short chain dehydrogenase [Quadrisphaera granulorum]PWJ54605.1 NAD(P)-dependent dehydrogenase (short-subunit alcohol dehydrogenase family) [Quadrisphaera granulorum]SZE95967.1 NAD(P)-dependent dehydrogenase, short-chain alcohol dehydrogenase family [Quadrisphaera granulorum]